jgi:acetyl esterase/lipase
MSARRIDPMQRLDPELRRGLDFYLKLFPARSEPPGPERVVPMREGSRALAKPVMSQPAVVERTIRGFGDAPDVLVFVINADPRVPRPAILHIHGGGFFAGSATSGLADLQVQAKALDCVIVTVEYRLAPETPFPGALEDNYAALRWLYHNAEGLGVDRTRIALQGESAGGGHAAMLALAARERGEVPLCFQALTFPMLDDRTGSSRQPAEHIGTFLWTRELNVLGWSCLLGSPPGGETVPEGASPARAADFGGLPPTFIAVGDLDLFVEEDIAFASRLIAAGVATELLVLPGAPHGFQLLGPNSRVSRRFQLAHLNAFARVFDRHEFFELPEAAPRAVPPTGA